MHQVARLGTGLQGFEYPTFLNVGFTSRHWEMGNGWLKTQSGILGSLLQRLMHGVSLSAWKEVIWYCRLFDDRAIGRYHLLGLVLLDSIKDRLLMSDTNLFVQSRES